MTDSAPTSSAFVSDVHAPHPAIPTTDDTIFEDDEAELELEDGLVSAPPAAPEDNEAPSEHTPDSHPKQHPLKTNLDPRHQRRIYLMQQLFAYSFYADEALRQQHLLDHPEIQPIIEKLPELDQEIQLHAPERPVAQINKVDLAILRIIVFELKMSQTPKKVVIDEGIELAKEFGTESSPRFVNGVLAQLLK